MSYRIKTVSLATGIPSTTLRAWERRYHLITPMRTRSGYRVYSDRDIAMLARVKALVDEGLKISEAIEIARARALGDVALHLPDEETGRIRAELLDALMALDLPSAAGVWRRLVGVGPAAQIDQILLPLMVEVGDRWEDNDCSVGQEHFCSAFVREKLVGLLAMDESRHEANAGRPVALCAGAPGELHEFGLMAAAAHLGLRGWRLLYLGADLPVDEIARIAGQVSPRLLVSSVIGARSRAECLSLAASFRAAVQDDVTIVLGGRGLEASLPRDAGSRTFFVRSFEEMLEAGEATTDPSH
jgi:MerR family transcriptional regulator, light-induced transcriptional regulator